MNRDQLADDHNEALRVAFDGHSARTWSAGPGILQTYDADNQTCTVQLAIMGLITDTSGATKATPITVLVDCPVQFAGGGGSVMTWPLANGDEGLMVFADRCIDSWWQSGGVQPPYDLRMHDLSDGFFIPGIRSLPRKLANVSAVASQWRSDDGSTAISLNPTAQTVDIVAPGGITLNGIPWDTHQHTGVESGVDMSGGPVA